MQVESYVALAVICLAGTLGDDDLLKRYKARQFIGIITETEVMAEFNIGLYFALV